MYLYFSYAEGNGLEWEHFGNEIMRVATARPYMVIGNHEYDYTQKGTNDPSLLDNRPRMDFTLFGEIMGLTRVVNVVYPIITDLQLPKR